MSKKFLLNNVRKLRFNNEEMTQQQLADKVGVTRQTIVAIEGEKYSPSLELSFRIAYAFNEPIENVFSYDPTLDPINNKEKKK